MNKYLLLLFFLLPTTLYSQVKVNGYYRKDGTYVRPHERTAPNSTITDNYSYPGNYNPNLEYNKPLPRTSTYNNNYHSQKTNKSNNLDQKTKSTSIKKYVNTTSVNVRLTPDISDNIIKKLNYSDEVYSLYSLGDWDKVEIKTYDPETYQYSYINGYIHNNYLSTYSTLLLSENKTELTNEQINYDTKYYKVINNKAYFHSRPNINDRKNSYLIYGEKIFAIAESKYFVYVEFKNSSGVETIGWIFKDVLIKQ